MSSGRDEAKPWPLSDLKQGLAADYYAVCEATIPPLVIRFNERHAACAAQLAAATAKALDEYDRARVHNPDTPLVLTALRTACIEAEAKAVADFELELDALLDRNTKPAQDALSAFPLYPPEYATEMADMRVRYNIRLARMDEIRIDTPEYHLQCIEYRNLLRHSENSIMHEDDGHIATRRKSNEDAVKKMRKLQRRRTMKVVMERYAKHVEQRTKQSNRLTVAMHNEQETPPKFAVVGDPTFVRADGACLPVRMLCVPELTTEVAAYCKHCALCFGKHDSTAAVAQLWSESKQDVLLRLCPKRDVVRCCDAIEVGRVYRGFVLAELHALEHAAEITEEVRAAAKVMGLMQMEHAAALTPAEQEVRAAQAAHVEDMAALKKAQKKEELRAKKRVYNATYVQKAKKLKLTQQRAAATNSMQGLAWDSSPAAREPASSSVAPSAGVWGG